jgi:hypothetical protein
MKGLETIRKRVSEPEADDASTVGRNKANAVVSRCLSMA